MNSNSENPDGYNFVALCPQCKEKRGVSASRAEILSGGAVKVYAIACDHSWTLTTEEADKLRRALNA